MTTERRVTIETPLGDALQFRQLKGHEELSQLYEFELDLISKSDKDIDPKVLLGKNCTVIVETEGGGQRYLDGIVIQFGLQGQDTRSHYSYRMVLAPWLWLATRQTNFKIHQHQSVPQIIQETLAPFGYPFELKLSRSYRQRDYTVIYNETLYNFISRLCESEGIYWYYQHSQGRHVVVFCDDAVASHSPLPGGERIPFHAPNAHAQADQEHIYAWKMAQNVRQGQAYLDDYDFKKPRADLSAMRRNPPGHSHDQSENYTWPGNYTEHADGDTYTRLQMEAGLSKHHRTQAQLTKRNIAPGYTIELTGHPRESENQKYLVIAVDYHLEENVQTSDGAGGAARTAPAPGTAAATAAATSAGRAELESGSIQRFGMQAHPLSQPYRPAQRTRKPRTGGPQTAVVVGPAGQEIYTDQYGRVKVQFFWDRIGAMDENSSCWVRVSTSWAGPQFGAIFIPRIGMEVIIDFLNGDPDYPILTGCVYNADNMPPWALPDNATQSGIKTKSSQGGAFGAGEKNGPGDANALRFEDKKGEEQLWLHAQKDQLIEVENDESHWVGRDRAKTIDRDETNHIQRDRTETVDRNEKITVHGWRTEEVDGDETITIHSNRSERVDHNESISIGDNRREDVGIDESITIGKNRTKKVGKNEKDTIGKNWSIKVGMLKTETVGMAYMQNVGLAKVMSIGATYMENIGMLMQTNVGMNQNLSVGKNREVSVGANQKTSVTEERSTSVGKNDKLVVGEELLVHAKKIQLEADQEIVLTCGSSTIKITADDIQILSPLDRLNC